MVLRTDDSCVIHIMYRRIFSALLLVLVVTALMGCERPGFDEERTVVGSWVEDRRTIRTFLSVDEEQTILDPMEPGQGEITLSGHVETTLTYMRHGVNPFLDLFPLLVSDTPVIEVAYAEEFNRGAVVLELPENPRQASVYVGRSRYLVDPDRTAAINVDKSRGTVALNDVPFTRDRRDTIFASGTLEGATMTLSAGSSTQVSTLIQEWPADERTTYRFKPDSTLLIVPAAGDTSRHRWRREDDELVLRFTGGATSRYSYRVRGEELFLETTYACEEEQRDNCLGFPEFAYGVREGTLTGARQVWERHFMRQD